MMSDANKVAAEDSIEAVIANSAGSDTSQEKKSVPAKRSKAGLLFISVLLLVVASVGGLQLTGQLQPLYESAKARVNQLSSMGQSPNMDESQTNRVSTPQPAEVSQKPVSAALTSQPVPVQTAAPNLPDVNSEEVRVLLSTMQQLRTEMQQLESSQQALQSGLLEQQQMNTQVRLRWIADPASRLPQMQLAWEEISLLPGLSDEQRQLAVEMHALARSNVQRLKQWQGDLQKWADALATPVHENVLPQPEQPWLAWIVGQFQLRQAPSQEARRLADLRSRLLGSARQLTLESWPSQGAWQRLQAELLLQITAMQTQYDQVDGATVVESAIETGLPADFTGIQTDITTLRQAAIQWGYDEQQGEVL